METVTTSITRPAVINAEGMPPEQVHGLMHGAAGFHRMHPGQGQPLAQSPPITTMQDVPTSDASTPERPAPGQGRARNRTPSRMAAGGPQAGSPRPAPMSYPGAPEIEQTGGPQVHGPHSERPAPMSYPGAPEIEQTGGPQTDAPQGVTTGGPQDSIDASRRPSTAPPPAALRLSSVAGPGARRMRLYVYVCMCVNVCGHMHVCICMCVCIHHPPLLYASPRSPDQVPDACAYMCTCVCV